MIDSDITEEPALLARNIYQLSRRVPMKTKSQADTAVVDKLQASQRPLIMRGSEFFSTRTSLNQSIDRRQSHPASYFTCKSVAEHMDTGNCPTGVFEQVDTEALSFLPVELYCNHCNTKTFSQVEMLMPTFSVWKQFCCFSDVVLCCSKPKHCTQFEVYLHRCNACRKILGRVNPEEI